MFSINTLTTLNNFNGKIEQYIQRHYPFIHIFNISMPINNGLFFKK